MTEQREIPMLINAVKSKYNLSDEGLFLLFRMNGLKVSLETVGRWRRGNHLPSNETIRSKLFSVLEKLLEG